MNYISGTMLKELREKRNLTQKELAEKLRISDKTISKWETGKGLPDITLVAPLAEALGISVAELFAGEYAVNDNRSANVKNLSFTPVLFAAISSPPSAKAIIIAAASNCRSLRWKTLLQLIKSIMT